MIRVTERPVQPELIDNLSRQALPLKSDKDLNPLIEQIHRAKYVLMGESTHGTSEFYQWRANLTRQLILEKGFSFIAVEGDWPDCYLINRYVKGYPKSGKNAAEVLENFRRWPTWMWANEEIAELMEWLRKYNRALPPEKKVGFYGLDVYSLWESLNALTYYLGDSAPDLLAEISLVFNCFEPYGEDVREYAKFTAISSENCEKFVNLLLDKLKKTNRFDNSKERDAHFAAQQNAWVIKNAESYYRSMIGGGVTSWNIRDFHMMDTLDRLMKHHGTDARCIVWEHNTHIGDARYTDMVDIGEINVGQLARERHGEKDVFIIGFSTYKGSVVAGREWNAQMQIMAVPEARAGSWDEIFHTINKYDKLFIFRSGKPTEHILEMRGQRAIGVVYNPEIDRFANYVPTIITRRYNALLYFEKTTALRPLGVSSSLNGEPPDTYPWAI